ncbi:dehydrogenase FPY6-like isoform X3 [Tasmannia lanceolata]|uniref:dehydrogenase FPY6-like isoform X3 n=1 Tax=Tasmannia lanceolata TaxID=3420 RepID=UPI0040643A6D
MKRKVAERTLSEPKKLKQAAPEMTLPQIALLGAGMCARTHYIPVLRQMADIVVIKTIWSHTEESARTAMEVARDFSPEIECKWGDEGLNEISRDKSIHGVAIVLAGHVQLGISLKMLKAGKHVLQEKPAGGFVTVATSALSCYKSYFTNISHQPIWAVGENYRFEPAFVESRKRVKNIGDMGGFILDLGVRYIAGLRMIIGCEITAVSAISSHVDKTLPTPDNICALLQLENGCAGVFVMALSSRSNKVPNKIYWRVVGSQGTLQVEQVTINGMYGYMVSFCKANGHWERSFSPSSGLDEELKAFINDISLATRKDGEAEPRSSFIEATRDLAVVEAMLESGKKHGAQVHVKTV